MMESNGTPSKWTKQAIAYSFYDLEKRLGRRPKMNEFLKDKKTPSNKPLINQFGNWNGLIKAIGLIPERPLYKYTENTIWYTTYKGSDLWIEIIYNAEKIVRFKENGITKRYSTIQFADYMYKNKPLLVVRDNSKKGYHLFDTKKCQRYNN